jgi:hypothetical protein
MSATTTTHATDPATISMSAHRPARYTPGFPGALAYTMPPPPPLLRLTYTRPTMTDPATGERVTALVDVPEGRIATAAQCRARLGKIINAAYDDCAGEECEEEMMEILREVALDGDEDWGVRNLREMLLDEDYPTAAQLRKMEVMRDHTLNISSAWHRLQRAEKRELAVALERRSA